MTCQINAPFTVKDLAAKLDTLDGSALFEYVPYDVFSIKFEDGKIQEHTRCKLTDKWNMVYFVIRRDYTVKHAREQIQQYLDLNPTAAVVFDYELIGGLIPSYNLTAAPGRGLKQKGSFMLLCPDLDIVEFLDMVNDKQMLNPDTFWSTYQTSFTTATVSQDFFLVGSKYYITGRGTGGLYHVFPRFDRENSAMDYFYLISENKHGKIYKCYLTEAIMMENFGPEPRTKLDKLKGLFVREDPKACEPETGSEPKNLSDLLDIRKYRFVDVPLISRGPNRYQPQEWHSVFAKTAIGTVLIGEWDLIKDEIMPPSSYRIEFAKGHDIHILDKY